MTTIGRAIIGAMDDIATGLDNGARWVTDQIGIIGLMSLGISGGLLWLLAEIAHG